MNKKPLRVTCFCKTESKLREYYPIPVKKKSNEKYPTYTTSHITSVDQHNHRRCDLMLHHFSILIVQHYVIHPPYLLFILTTSVCYSMLNHFHRFRLFYSELMPVSVSPIAELGDTRCLKHCLYQPGSGDSKNIANSLWSEVKFEFIHLKL